MNEPNPYRAPESTIVETRAITDLADRGVRLGAAIIDALILLVVLLPAMFFGGYFSAVMAAAQAGDTPSFGLIAMWGVIGLVLFVVVQGYPLSATGQTWGKKFLGIKIVDMDGNKPPFGKLLALRYLPVQAVSLVPIVGNILPLINVLLILRSDYRCGHDLIAGTRVVKAR